MKKKFDVVTAKKIINEYAEKLNFYMKDNMNIKMQLEDTKTTLSLNKEILFNFISQNKSDHSEMINILTNENNRLSEKINSLFNEKNLLEKKLYRTEQALDDKIISQSEGVEKLKERIFILENKLRDRESLISSMKNELEKYFYETNNDKREIFIAEPDRYNLELYNELSITKELYHKVSKMLSNEKANSVKLMTRIKDHEERINLLKQGIKANRKDSISILELSSDEEENVTERSEITVNCDSPIVLFPEKIKMTKHIEAHLPKLDLSKVKAKYADPSNNKIAIVNKVLKSNRSNNEYIEKLKFQLKMCKNTIKIFKKKFEKYKKMITLQKQEIARCRSKNQLLEIQLKKSGSSTYDGTFSHKNINNTSMANNAENEDILGDVDIDDLDFNNIIKEYNRNVVLTSEFKNVEEN